MIERDFLSGCPSAHLDDLEPSARSDIVAVDVFAVHVDDEYARVRDLVLVECAVVARFTVC